MSDERPEAGAGRNPAPEADEGSRQEQRRLWQEALVQEALDSRPELRTIAGKLDFAASRARGFDQGFEDAARRLSPAQLGHFQTLLDRRVTRYVREEMPQDLQAELADASLGMEEAGYLAGYVDGVGAFLEAYRRRLGREE